MSETRRCTKCGEEKRPEAFGRRTDSGALRADCRSCCSTRGKEWRSKNSETVNAAVRSRRLARPEQFLAYSRTYRAANTEQYLANQRRRADEHPQRHADEHLRSRYGITLAQKHEILASQGGRCAVCGTDTPGKPGWHLDHDHETGRPRGVLCRKCNTGIGMLGDSPTLLHAAISYLTSKPLRLVKEHR